MGLAIDLQIFERLIAKVEAEATPALATIQYGDACRARAAWQRYAVSKPTPTGDFRSACLSTGRS
jgi:hypothetical protein